MNTEEKTISVKELLSLLFGYKKIFALTIIVCTIISFVYNTFMVVPTYTSTGSIYINCMSSSDYAEDGISQYEIESSRILSTTYMEVLLGRTFLETVSADIGYKYDYKQLAGMVRVASINETELLAISVTAYEPEDAYIICKSIINNSPQKMESIFKRGTIEVIDEVNMPTVPSKPSFTKKLIMGVGIGFLLGALIVFLIEVFDTRFRSAEALASRYKITVLGEIIS